MNIYQIDRLVLLIGIVDYYYYYCCCCCWFDEIQCQQILIELRHIVCQQRSSPLSNEGTQRHLVQPAPTLTYFRYCWHVVQTIFNRIVVVFSLNKKGKNEWRTCSSFAGIVVEVVVEVVVVVELLLMMLTLNVCFFCCFVVVVVVDVVDVDVVVVCLLKILL